VKFVFKLRYSMHRARLAVGHATKAATLAIRAMLTCSHHLLRTTGANLDLGTIKSAGLCHDYLGSRWNIQKSSKTFSLSFQLQALHSLPSPASNKRSRPDRVGFGRVKRVHPIVIDSCTAGSRTFDSCKVGKIPADS